MTSPAARVVPGSTRCCELSTRRWVAGRTTRTAAHDRRETQESLVISEIQGISPRETQDSHIITEIQGLSPLETQDSLVITEIEGLSPRETQDSHVITEIE